MFDNKTTAAWQGVSPDPALKARVLQQAVQSRKVTPFPAKAVRRAMTAAACVVLALVLLNPTPQVSLGGMQPGTAMAAYSRQAEVQQTVTLLLNTDGKTTLTTEDGWVEQQGESALWHLPGEGEYTLTATRGRRSEALHIVVTKTDDGWSVDLK